MAQINKYANCAAYDADTTRLRTMSSVSQIDNENSMSYDGVNVVAPKSAAEIGDLVVFDKSASTIKVVKCNTLNKSMLPSELLPVGVVYHTNGVTAYVVSLGTA